MVCRLFLTASLFVFAPLTSNAGDLSEPVVEAPVVAPPVVASDRAWEGFYLGGSLGYSFAGDDRVGIRGNTPIFDIGTLSNEGTFGGLHLGYRWRLDSFSFSAELGVEGGSVESDIAGARYSASMGLKNSINFRINAGLIVQEKTMIYGFAGVSRGDFDYVVSGNGAAGPVSISENITETGYIVGAGLERAISTDWSVRTEYRYANFGKVLISDAAGNTTAATPDYHSIALGINYSF